MSEPEEVIDEDWEVLLGFFPPQWIELAAEQGALKGLRQDKSPERLIRTLLLHVGCGYSLRESAVRARQAGLADLSDVALLKRLRKCGPWLHSLCQGLFAERFDLSSRHGRRIHLLDGTMVSEPGRTGSHWRIHYSLRWPELTCDFFRITPSSGAGTGENAAHFPIEKDGYYLADRGYCLPSGIAHIVDRGADITLRVNPDSVRLCNSRGATLDLKRTLERVGPPGEAFEQQVQIRSSKSKVVARGRLCIIRKSAHAARKAQRRLHHRAQKNGTQLRDATLHYAKFIIVFTTLGADKLNASQVLDDYRLRWQVELLFKRLKQITGLGHLPKHDEQSAQAWLHGKLFVALLVDKLAACADSFSPWGYELKSRQAAPAQ